MEWINSQTILTHKKPQSSQTNPHMMEGLPREKESQGRVMEEVRVPIGTVLARLESQTSPTNSKLESKLAPLRVASMLLIIHLKDIRILRNLSNSSTTTLASPCSLKVHQNRTFSPLPHTSQVDQARPIRTL